MKYVGMLLLAAFLFSILSPVQPAAAAQEACPETYRVVLGDWLSKIAARCGTTLRALLEANPNITNPERILVGQAINIPGQGPPQPRLTLASTNGAPGSILAFTLNGFPADTEVEISAGRAGESLVSLSKDYTNSSGALAYHVTLPESAQPDEVWVVAAAVAAEAVAAEAVAAAAVAGSSQAAVVSEPILITGTPPVYVIQRGDRLGTIASRFGVSLAALLDVNPDIQNPNVIYVGRQLVIPAAGHEPSPEAVSRASGMGIPVTGRAERPSEVGTDERWIAVNLSTQSVHAYEGDNLVRSFIASTGRANTPTVTGQYRIYVKLRSTDMRGPGYHLKDVPYTMYFYKGYGLHGTYWHNNFGTPMSHGCVNLSTPDAEWLFNFASVGTLVSVRN